MVICPKIDLYLSSYAYVDVLAYAYTGSHIGLQYNTGFKWQRWEILCGRDNTTSLCYIVRENNHIKGRYIVPTKQNWNQTVRSSDSAHFYTIASFITPYINVMKKRKKWKPQLPFIDIPRKFITDFIWFLIWITRINF